MSVSTVDSTYLLSQQFLGVCETALAATTDGAPVLSYVYPVEPVIDCCPALIVFLSGLTEETTSPLTPPAATGLRAAFGRLNLLTLNAWILRCAPRTNADGSVDVVEIERVAEQVQQDAWALWNGIYRAVREGTFEDTCSDVHYGPSRPIREQGGCLGWAFTIRAELGGFAP